MVNVSELNTDAVSVNNSMSTVCGELKIVGIPQRRKRVAAVSVQGMPNGRGQLGDEVVLEDGISEKTVTIDQGLKLFMAPESVIIIYSLNFVCCFFRNKLISGTVPGNEKVVMDQRSATTIAGGTNAVLGPGIQQQQVCF